VTQRRIDTASRPWRARPAPPPGFADSIGLSPFQAHLLYNRGVRHLDDVEPYLAGDRRQLHDPMLLPAMAAAVDRLAIALDRQETIAVYGDFDTDGVAGTALLLLALRALGAAPLPYIPDRADEGHGLNAPAVRVLRGRGATLLVTVDCGTASQDEIALAASLGMDTVVTDHHSLPAALPLSVALVNPHRPDATYPYDGLAGSGLAFKLAEALFARLGRPWPGHLLELAALGTVADVAPLTGENRHIVKLGLERLRQTRNVGIKALAAVANTRLDVLDTDALSFSIVPRLNAAGRLGDAGTSLRLLTTTDAGEAAAIAGLLDQMNARRQRLTEEGMAQAQPQAEEQVKVDAPVLFVGRPDWLPGLLGLIAGRLAEQHHRPAVAMLTSDGACRASVRSIPGLDIVAALNDTGASFLRIGGHSQAAGFTIAAEHLEPFKRSLTALVQERANGQVSEPSFEYDCEVALGLVDHNTVAFVQSLAPFGAGNPEPLFLSRNARVLDARLVGADGKHLKMRVSQGGGILDAIAFRQGPRYALLPNRVDLLYTVGLDDWSGQPRLQLQVVDFRQPG
jgi:single-stranded-DNA-specific exonuclease